MIVRLIPYIFWLYAAGLFGASVIPWSTTSSVHIGEFRFRMDYMLHFMCYFGLAILFVLFQISRGKNKPNTSAFNQSYIITIMAIITEIMQLPVPGRNFNFIDLFFNISGLFSGILFFQLIRKWVFSILFSKAGFNFKDN